MHENLDANKKIREALNIYVLSRIAFAAHRARAASKCLSRSVSYDRPLFLVNITMGNKTRPMQSCSEPPKIKKNRTAPQTRNTGSVY